MEDETFEAFGWKEAKPALYPLAKEKGFTENICDARSPWNRGCYRPKGHPGVHESRSFGEKHAGLALARWYGDERDKDMKVEKEVEKDQANENKPEPKSKEGQTSLTFATEAKEQG